jgi:GntR family transcriptional regulator
MLFQLDFNAATALYRQLVDQVRFSAASGTLKPHDPLPPIRSLARQLHLNRNTVAKAYTELESLGVIKTIPGKGSFVEPVNTPFLPKVRHKLLVAKIDAALVAAHQLQVDAPSFAALVADRTKFFEGKIKDAKPLDSTLIEETFAKKPNVATPSQKSPSSLKRRQPGASESQPSFTIPPQTSSATDSENWSPSMD